MSYDNSVSPYLPPTDMPSFVPADPGAAPAVPDAPAVPMTEYVVTPAPGPAPSPGSTYGLPPGAPMPQFPPVPLVAPAAVPAPVPWTAQVPPAYPLAYPPATAPFPQPYGAVPAYPGQALPVYPYLAKPFPKNHFGVMALVFGILSILVLGEVGNGSLTTSWATDPGTATGTLLFVLACPVLALVMGITGIRAFGRRQANNRGLAISGVVMGSIFFAILLLGLVAVLGS